LLLLLEAAHLQLATCNLPPAATKNFQPLTSTVFSATFPPFEKENLRAFSRDW